jgi:TRAP-type mannitol/chloroaromatic compound transport system permease small subunit
MHRAEEQAAAYQLQTAEHIQRLQAMHAEALNMRQQEVIVMLSLILRTFPHQRVLCPMAVSHVSPAARHPAAGK